MSTNIIAFSGRRLSGKNTCALFIKELIPEAQEFAFARALKRMCVDILGLREEQAFGSEADKNTIVPHLLWENFPVPSFAKAKRGPMTAREVLQYWGSEIFRRQYSTVWADACIREIKASKAYALGYPCVITDCRFPDEVQATREAGGRIIRLTRVANPNDRHQSEIALDGDVYDWANFDAILDNHDIGVDTTCLRLDKILEEFGVTAHIDPICGYKAAQVINERVMRVA